VTGIFITLILDFHLGSKRKYNQWLFLVLMKCVLNLHVSFSIDRWKSKQIEEVIN